MFHKEFYPTPAHVIDMMGIDCKGKVVLEPHAGKGDIVDFCKRFGAKEVLAFEINKDLQHIVKSKAKLIGEDFFDCKPEQISHVNAIYMNPPFSNADKHIIHAWKIAPEGCEIIALCNYETINKSHRYDQLSGLIRDYGNTENLGDCFSTAERTTGIEIGLLKLFKPVTSANFEFEGFYMDEDDQEEDGEGIMQYNEVRALVNRYVGTMKNFDKLKEQIDVMSYSVKGIGMSSITLSIGYNNTITTKEDFSKLLQKESWKHIFAKMNMSKYVTSGVMKDINTFVETQTKVPFTMKNIYKMFEIIVGTREETFKRALEEAVDNFTKHTHENRFGVEGWKTNSGYMLNKKFIIESVLSSYGRGLEIGYDTHSGRKMDDLVKVMCSLTGNDYNNYSTFHRINYSQTHEKLYEIQPNTWYEWAFFEFKVFKKGSMHLKFKNIDDWYVLNQAYGKLKGFTLHTDYKK